VSRQAALAEGFRYAKELTTRYLAGIDEAERTRQFDVLPNHPVWCLGHCALTMHRVAEVLDGSELPDSDFLQGGSLEGGGDGQRFATESIAFSSKPSPDASQYPSLGRAKEIFESACERMASAIESAGDADLERDIPWGKTGAPIKLRLLLHRVLFHNGHHTGQIVDTRRAMGLGRVLG